MAGRGLPALSTRVGRVTPCAPLHFKNEAAATVSFVYGSSQIFESLTFGVSYRSKAGSHFVRLPRTNYQMYSAYFLPRISRIFSTICGDGTFCSSRISKAKLSAKISSG